MATALGKLREQVIDAYINGGVWRTKARRIQQAVRRKVAQLLTDDVVARLGQRPWEWDLETFVNYHLDQAGVDFLFMRTADLRFFAARRSRRTSRAIVFGASDGPGVECYRDDTTLLINRTGQVGATESWSRRLSLTRTTGPNAYTKHLYEENYRGMVAKYAAGLLPRDVETNAVKRGLGHFDGNRLFFYARFAGVTGMVRSGAGRVETHYLKVQIDRAKRPAFHRLLKSGQRRGHQDGWEVHMHGYPISADELANDFPAGAHRVNRVAINLP